MIQPAFSASDFAVTQGTPKQYTHLSKGSGKQIDIHFCDTCGTKLFQTFERFDGAVGLYRGTLDDPNWVNVTPENSKHIFIDTAQDETLLPAHTPIYREHAVQNDGTPNDPMVLTTPQRSGDL